MAASFARTLRAFAEKQRAEASRTRPSPATPITQRRPLTTLGSLPRGPQKTANGKVPQPANASAPAEKAAPAEKPLPAAEKAPTGKPGRRQSTPLLARVWSWLRKQPAFSAKKQLRISDTISLGEKRFVAVVHIEGQRFLIGGGSAGVSLLTELDTETEPGINPALDTEETSPIVQSIACGGGRSR